jgi:F0F1-type ATP synthase assembly protein I
MLSPDALRAMARASAMVLEMWILIVVGAVAGHWLDEHLGTSPLFLLCLSSAMLAGGIYRINRTIGNASRPDDP